MRPLLVAILFSFTANLVFAHDVGPAHKLFTDSARLKTFALLPDVVTSTPSNAVLPMEEKMPAKNRGKAFFMSLLVPGWGQHYANAATKRNVFLGAEISMWLTFAGFKSYSAWREQDYKAYAATHAGVNLEGKNNTYFIDVGNFASIYEHNDYRLQQRNFKKYYQDIDYYFWQWESEASRVKFDELRVSADTADNRALFMLGAIVANHVVSAIDAVWSVYRYENARLSHIDLNLQFGDGVLQPTWQLSLSARF